MSEYEREIMISYQRSKLGMINKHGNPASNGLFPMERV
jgi:hypothetical protein